MQNILLYKTDIFRSWVFLFKINNFKEAHDDIIMRRFIKYHHLILNISLAC